MALTVAVVLIACGVTAAVLVSRHEATKPTASGDCALVADLGQRWMSMMSTVTDALLNGPGERDDFIAVAERESAMAEELRSGAGSVSAPEIKSELVKWADSTAAFAQIQRDVAERPPGTPTPPGPPPNYLSASATANEAAEALTGLCPGLPWE